MVTRLRQAPPRYWLVAALTLVLGRGVFKAYARRGARLFEMMMVTLGLSLIINYSIQALSHNNIYQFNVLPSTLLQFGSILITRTQLVIILISVGVLISLQVLLRWTKIGKALRAMAADPDLARACGIKTGQIVVLTWLLSGFLCGLAGVVYIINAQSVGYTTGQLFLPLVVADHGRRHRGGVRLRLGGVQYGRRLRDPRDRAAHATEQRSRRPG